MKKKGPFKRFLVITLDHASPRNSLAILSLFTAILNLWDFFVCGLGWVESTRCVMGFITCSTLLL